MARTTLDLDAKLIGDAMRLANGKTKKAVIEEALQEYIRSRAYERLRQMIGKVELDLTPEDLRRMRGCDDPSLSR